MKSIFSNKGYNIALSGGGFRGFSHLGFSKALYDLKIPVKKISGSSAGAVMAVLFASDNFEEIYYKILDYKTRNYISLLKPLPPGRGALFSADKIIKRTEQLTGVKSLEELNVKTYISTTEFSSGKNFIYSEGPLNSVLKASFTIPGVFPPVNYDNKLLVDGDLSNPLPFEIFNSKKVLCAEVKTNITGYNVKTLYGSIMHTLELMSNDIMNKKIEYLKQHDIPLFSPKIKNVGSISLSKSKSAILQGYDQAYKFLKKLINKGVIKTLK